MSFGAGKDWTGFNQTGCQRFRKVYGFRQHPLMCEDHILARLQAAEPRIVKQASRLAAGDCALWLHHYSKLMHWSARELRGDRSYRLEEAMLHCLPEIEKSVIQGWREYVKNVLGLDYPHQKGHSFERALALERIRRHCENGDDLGSVLKRESPAFCTAVNQGDVDFFKSVGKLLNDKPRNKERYRLAHDLLRRWIGESYWLMTPKVIARLVTLRWGVKNMTENRIAVAKSRYRLKSNSPAFIVDLKEDGERLLSKQALEFFDDLRAERITRDVRTA